MFLKLIHAYYVCKFYSGPYRNSSKLFLFKVKLSQLMQQAIAIYKSTSRYSLYLLLFKNHQMDQETNE